MDERSGIFGLRIFPILAGSNLYIGAGNPEGRSRRQSSDKSGGPKSEEQIWKY